MRRAVRIPFKTKAIVWAIGLVAAAVAGSFDLFLIFFGVPFLIDMYRMSKVKGPEVMNVREGLIRRVIEFWGPEFEYRPWQGIPKQEFEHSRLIDESYDRYRSMDFVAGKYGATAFRFAEVELERSRKRNGRTEWVSVWSGIFLVADFNKSFQGRLWVLPDDTERHLGLVARALQRLPFHGRGQLIHLDSPEFERHFKVYGDDQQEARYILSTSLMRRIVEFRKSMDLEIELAFLDGQIYLALPVSGDFFRAPSIDRIDEAHIRSWVSELNFMTSIIEELDLNTRIWSKYEA